MANQRRTFKPEEKVAILRRHLLDGAAVSDLCDEHGPNPTVFYPDAEPRIISDNGPQFIAKSFNAFEVSALEDSSLRCASL